jgi:hypothetical protein
MWNEDEEGKRRQLKWLSREGESTILTEANRRGHDNRTRYAAVGAGTGAAIGSFGGPLGALAGGALGGWLGSVVGDERDANSGGAR